MMSPEIVEGPRREAVGAEVHTSYSVFVVDDNARARCSVCVDRCPTDTLYYARLPEGAGGGQDDGGRARVAARRGRVGRTRRSTDVKE